MYTEGPLRLLENWYKMDTMKEFNQSMKNVGENADTTREKVAGALEELMTDPKFSWIYKDPHSIISSIRKGEKIPSDRLSYDTVVRVGQDLGLTPDEIDELVDNIFNK